MAAGSACACPQLFRAAGAILVDLCASTVAGRAG
jgi:hypothetical protein